MGCGSAESLVFIWTDNRRIDLTLQFPAIELTDRLTGKNPQGLISI
jgi:hypothetical protein